jgi:hypothetical protein
MMLVMRVMMTIRTGQSVAHSTAWFTWVSTTGLAQRHPPPEVACELAHFLRQWHRLIEIGQELAKHSSSCHLYILPVTVRSVESQCVVLPSPFSLNASGIRTRAKGGGTLDFSRSIRVFAHLCIKCNMIMCSIGVCQWQLEKDRLLPGCDTVANARLGA